MLPDLALVDSTEKILGDSLSDDKKLVKNFYDNRGWHTTEKGDYEDADIFEDLRPFAQEYLTKCHNRVSRYLHPKGTYLMDAASGALQFKDYLQYSENYTYRICVDLSFQGLQEYIYLQINSEILNKAWVPTRARTCSRLTPLHNKISMHYTCDA